MKSLLAGSLIVLAFIVATPASALNIHVGPGGVGVGRGYHHGYRHHHRFHHHHRHFRHHGFRHHRHY